MSRLEESVSGICFSVDRKSLLLIKRRDVPVWVLPGGGIEPFETPEEGIIREFQEETGLKVRIVRKIAEYTPLCRLAHYTHFYECAVIEGTPQTGSETKEIRFFPLSTLPKRMPPPYPDQIADAQTMSQDLLRKEIKGVTYPALIKNLILHPILVIRFLLARIKIPFNT